MASGIRSIVWRSDIDAGRERPAFFYGLVAKRGGEAQLVEQLADQLSSSQLFQLFMILLAREGRGERAGRRDRKRGEGWREGENWRGWKKMENYWLNE